MAFKDKPFDTAVLAAKKEILPETLGNKRETTDQLVAIDWCLIQNSCIFSGKNSSFG